MTPPSDRLLRLEPGTDSPFWSGAVDWESDARWWQPWRLPAARAAETFAPDLVIRARMSAGVRARVRTDATALRCTIDMLDEDGATVDLVIDGGPVERRPLTVGRNELTWTLPGEQATAELWLPHFGELRITAPELVGATSAQPVDHPGGLRWTCYGSSITQCRSSLGPTETWPALVARDRGWDLTCFGFGGQCHLDPVAVETVAEHPADLVSLCLGINVHGNGGFNARTWPGQVAGVIRRVRRGHPGIPILVQSPIVSPEREQQPNQALMTLEDYRADVHRVVTLLSADDPALFLLDGTRVVGSDDVDLLEDGLHPGPEGYRVMAERIGRALDGCLAASGTDTAPQG